MGEIITARILSANIKAEHETAQTTQQLSQTPASKAPSGTSPEARAAQLFSATQQLATAEGSKSNTEQPLRLWQLALQVVETKKTLQTEILAKQLPPELSVGKLLTLKVLPQQGLQVVHQPSPETSLENTLRPIIQALSKWLPLQSELKGGLSNILAAGQETTQSSPPLPAPVRELAKQLSSAILKQADLAQPEALKSAIKDSGINLESKLLRETKPLSDIKPGQAVSDRNPLTTDSNLAQLAPKDIKALLMTSLSTLLSHLQQSPNQALPKNWEALVNWLTQQVANYTQGGHPLAFPSMHQTGTSQHQPSTQLDAGEILRALAQAISRIHVNQLNALQQSLTPAPDGTNTQVWFLELPIQGQRLDSVQIRMEKENQDDKEKKKQQARWKLILAFDLEHIGPFQSHVLYTDGTVSATFWADQQHTLKLVNSELPHLRKGLQDWGLQVGDLAVRKGSPPPPQTPISRQLIDERA
ncbi:hypothetical protein BTA51_23390 [Hahella sp. CCB-MM4]|nr:hypothetical protein BTA51_23390 [Hahella sp. CCB-MM4]